MGTLRERRKDLRGRSKVESGLKWAKLTFGHMLKNKHAIFVVPDELNLKHDAIMPAEKWMFNKEEFLEIMMAVGGRSVKDLIQTNTT